MTKKALQEAVDECQRFQKKAKETLAAWKEDAYPAGGDTRLTAATKRASMDLTRALAAIRKYQ